MATKEQSWVFVKMSIMLGDGDGSMRGYAVVPESKWNEDKKKFTDHLAKINEVSVTRQNDIFGQHRVQPEAWTVTPCTTEEAKILKKFFSETTTDFMWPSEFVHN